MLLLGGGRAVPDVAEKNKVSVRARDKIVASIVNQDGFPEMMELILLSNEGTRSIGLYLPGEVAESALTSCMGHSISRRLLTILQIEPVEIEIRRLQTSC